MSSARCFLVLVLTLLPCTAWGQAVPSREPSSTHIFPAGGRRGTTVTVRVGGECFPPGMKLTLWGKGVTAPALLGAQVKPPYEPSARRLPRDADGAGADMAYPREWASAISIAADAPLGTAHWRASGGWGGTQPRPFLVGELAEFIETEPNSEPERAERITLPVVVNGQIAGERDLDCFVFTAKAGDVVVFDVLAARIGSPLDPVVEISDFKGRRIEAEEVRIGGDPVLAFRAAAAGDYRVSIANVSFHGGPQYVYRMTVTTAPFVIRAFPPGGKAGETREIEFHTLTGTGSPHAVKERVTFPASPGLFLHRGIRLIAGEYAEAVERDDNHSALTAIELTLPLTVNGRFLGAKEEDWFRFTAKKGETYSISCRQGSESSAAVPMMTLFDAAGNPLARASAADAPDRCAEIDWKAPADGLVRLCLRDLQYGTRGGPEFIYRLGVRTANPDFSLRLEQEHLNVVQGGKTEVDLIVRRYGSFPGPIELTAINLPDGVRIEPVRIAEGQTRIKLSVLAKDDVKPTDAVLRIRGKAVADGKELERLTAGDGLHLTVQHKPVFKLTCNEAYQYAHRGTIYPYAMKLERLNGFTGPVTIQLCDRQVQDLDGIEVNETVVPSGVSDFMNLVYLPETMHVSVQHHCRPYAQGYATFTDKWGQKQTLLAVSDKRCMIRTMPALVRLRALQDEVSVRPGEEIACKFALDRTASFAGAMQVELTNTPGFTAEKVSIAAGSREALMKVRLDKIAKQPPALTLRFRATGKLATGAAVVSEAAVNLKLQDLGEPARSQK